MCVLVHSDKKKKKATEVEEDAVDEGKLPPAVCMSGCCTCTSTLPVLTHCLNHILLCLFMVCWTAVATLRNQLEEAEHKLAAERVVVEQLRSINADQAKQLAQAEAILKSETEKHSAEMWVLYDETATAKEQLTHENEVRFMQAATRLMQQRVNQWQQHQSQVCA